MKKPILNLLNLVGIVASLFWTSCGSDNTTASTDEPKLAASTIEEYSIKLKALDLTNAQAERTSAIDTDRIKEAAKAKEAYKWMPDAITTFASDRDPLIDQLHDIKRKLEMIADFDKRTGKFGKPSIIFDTRRLMMGRPLENDGKGTAEANDLHRHLEIFENSANLFFLHHADKGTIPTIETLTPKPSEDRSLTAPENTEPTWEAAHFGNTAALVALVKIATIHAKVLEIDRMVLDHCLHQLGLEAATNDYGVPDGPMKLVCKPVQEVVAPGTKQEAQLVVENLPLEIFPEFLGMGVHNNPDRLTGALSVTAKGDFPKGQTEKESILQVRARIPHTDGGFEELSTECKFTIRKSQAKSPCTSNA
jgi:hypothetical protein